MPAGGRFHRPVADIKLGYEGRNDRKPLVLKPEWSWVWWYPPATLAFSMETGSRRSRIEIFFFFFANLGYRDPVSNK